MTTQFKDLSLKSWLLLGCFIISLSFIIFIHIWDIDKMPAGLYVDESSIGLNAAHIQNNLRDEHGQLLPIYFQAFGEYKNPVYIYTAALLFQINGISEFSLRLTSFVFFLVLAAGSFFLVRQMFPQRPITWLYTLIAVSTLPWFFSISRISFEIISLPAVLVWAMYFIYRTYQQAEAKATTYYALAAGLLVGLSTYTYSTSRLFSFLFIALLIAVYRHPEFWRRHVFFLASFIVSLIPYVYFALTNPGALTSRLSFISYIYDQNLSLFDKAQVFIINYLSYFDPQFLLISGDPNLRHHPGTTGQIYLAVAILAAIGISFVVLLRNSQHRKFGWVLILGLLLAPIPAAMTESTHGLRSLTMGFFILWLSAYGVAALELLPKTKIKVAALSLTFALLLIQANSYLNFYFGDYRQTTVFAFESYDFKTTLTQAIARQPQQIIVTDRANAPYAHLDFYSFIVDNPHNIPTSVQTPLANPDTCIITFNWDRTIDNPSNLPQKTHIVNDYSELTCY